MTDLFDCNKEIKDLQHVARLIFFSNKLNYKMHHQGDIILNKATDCVTRSWMNQLRPKKRHTLSNKALTIELKTPERRRTYWRTDATTSKKLLLLETLGVGYYRSSLSSKLLSSRLTRWQQLSVRHFLKRNDHCLLSVQWYRVASHVFNQYHSVHLWKQITRASSVLAAVLTSSTCNG